MRLVGMMVHVVPLVALPTAQKRAVVKHILGHGVQGPEISFSRIARLSRNFDEAVVETQIVSDRVLPRRKLFFVVPESDDEKLDIVLRIRTFHSIKEAIIGLLNSI